jgi:hypothetical protein
VSAFNNGAAIGVVEDATTAETASYSPSGSDRYMIAGAVAGGFGGAVDTSAFRYDGASGTSMSQVGSDITNGNPLTMTVWGATGGPSASTTGHATFAAAAQAGAIVTGHYTGVSSIGTPVTDSGTDGTGGNAFYDIAITVTGCTPGQRVVAIIAGASTSVDVTSFVGQSGTTVQRSAVSELALNGICLADKVAAGTSETINVRMNVGAAAPGGGLSFTAFAVELNDAGGGSQQGKAARLLLM